MHKTASAGIAKAHTRDSLQALAKLGELVDGQYRIVSQPPILIPARDLTSADGFGENPTEVIAEQLEVYRASLDDDRAQLLERFHLVDVARKVVGVGSVGTRAFIGLLQGRDEHDPLFLQVKEATASVLEDHLPEESLRQSRATGCAGPAPYASGQRHLLGLDPGTQQRLLLAPASRHERLS